MQEMRKNTRIIRGICGIGIAAVVVILDQLTKWLVSGNMEIGQSITVIPGVLRLTYITNPAAAMGLMENARWLFMILSPLVVVGILVYLFWAPKLSRLYSVAFAMIAGGGAGNMIDRMFYGERIGYGEVIDFVDFCAFPKIWSYIFNVADAFVCVGAALFLLAAILDMIRESREKKACDAVSETDGGSETVETVSKVANTDEATSLSSNDDRPSSEDPIRDDQLQDRKNDG